VRKVKNRQEPAPRGSLASGEGLVRVEVSSLRENLRK
jgi:hypothetical protein